MSFRFAVLADSHFHTHNGPAQAEWASDQSFNVRNAAAVRMVNQAGPRFVVHLGDIPHPLPGSVEHDGALDVAATTYARLVAPALFVPGNHDVGDKPHPWAPAPSVSAEKHESFIKRWGPAWWAVEREGLRLIGIDTPVLNSGLPLEAEQWEWLERVLVPGPRTFVFLHYPPFLLSPDEPEHYDNLAEPARARLLGLLQSASVEAVFCGHVHHPFWNRYANFDLYILPSTAFVRPGYSELGRVGPGDEFGRNDVERLGFFLVHVMPTGHRVDWVRTRGNTLDDLGRAHLALPPPARRRCPVGLNLRHAWDAVLDIPADGLDPFRKKQARNDLMLWATWELGVELLRLPLGDLRSPVTRPRLLALAGKGQRVVLYSPEPLSSSDLELIEEAAATGVLAAMELILPRAWLDRALPTLPVPRWVAPLGRAPLQTGAYFSHFTPHGFTADDPDLGRSLGERCLFRIDPEVDPVEGLERAARAAPGRAAALVLTPRNGEGRSFDDDAALCSRVERTLRAAERFPEIPVILDTFMDHDRGYFPRIGLLDRRGNPRPAYFQLLRAEERTG